MTAHRGSQPERLLAFLRTHPLASGMEIVTALAMPKYTSRISDLRAQGIEVVCERRFDGERGYRVIERRVDKGEQTAMALS